MELVKRHLDTLLLTLNVQKTELMAFSISPVDIAQLRPLYIHTCEDRSDCQCLPLTICNRVKYLGIFLDSKLNWEHHLTHIKKKLRKTVYLFKELTQIFDRNVVWRAYFSLCQSLLLYGIIGWGGPTSTFLDKLRTTQKLILKIILKRPRLYPTDQLFAEARVLDIRQLYVKTVLLHYKRHPRDMRRRTHGYETRARSAVLPPRMKKRFGQRHYVFLAPKFFNLIPDHIKIENNHSKFKKLIHDWLRQKGIAEVEQMLSITV